MRLLTPVLLAVCLATMLAPAAQAQTRLLVGQITDDGSKLGIPGATISVINGTQAARANPDGRYRLTIPSSPLRLQVRGLGFAAREIAVDATQTTLDVAMTQEAVGLNEVIVTGTGTSQARHNVATAVSTVSGTALSKAPSGSLESALQGKVVGAMINMNSGAPGGGGQIQIRGVTSILGNPEPLIIVDGVYFSNAAFSAGIEAVKRAGNGSLAGSTPQDNSVNRLADLNTEDIESIQVLKGAAASAIYGSRATNGVVLITTKRGRGRVTEFRLRQRAGVNTPDRLLGSRHFTQATLTDVLGATMAKQYCPTDPCSYYDYQGKVYGKRDLAYETSLSLSGGGDATTYFVSANDKNEPGTMINTGARHLSLRLNLDHAIGSRFTSSVSAAFYHSDAARGISNNDNSYTSPIYAFAYTPAVVDLQALGTNGQPIDNVILRTRVGGSAGANPFQAIAGITSTEDVWRQTAGAQVRYNALSAPNQTLNFSIAGGFDRFDAAGQTYSPNYLEFEADDGFSGTAAQTQALLLQYGTSVDAVHIYSPASTSRLRHINSLTTSAGIQYGDLASNRFSIVARGLLPGVENIDQGTPTLNQLKTAVRHEAVYVSEELLGLSDRFSASARVRAERASVDGDTDKWFYWPAASAAYRFVGVVPHADEIKLRASLGVSGNQPNYGMRDNVLIANGIYDGRNAIAQPSPIGNPTIEPERMRESEVGIDASFFGNRVGLEASYFNRTITNLLLQAPLAPTSGVGLRYINGGTLRTAGVELALNALPIHTADFSWSSRAQYYSFQSRIISLPYDVPDFPLAATAFGASFGRGYIAQGYRSTLIWGNKLLADGTVKEIALADANPDFQMAFGNELTFHGLTVNTLIDWRQGGYVVDLTNASFDEGGNSWDYDQPSPNPTVGKTLGAYRFKSWNGGKNTGQYIEDGSYVKLREVTITYLIPKRYAQRLRLGSHDARISFSGHNLHTWTKYWSFDPEVSNFGNQPIARFVDAWPYPPARSLLFGIDIGY